MKPVAIFVCSLLAACLARRRRCSCPSRPCSRSRPRPSSPVCTRCSRAARSSRASSGPSTRSTSRSSGPSTWTVSRRGLLPRKPSRWICLRHLKAWILEVGDAQFSLMFVFFKVTSRAQMILRGCRLIFLIVARDVLNAFFSQTE